MYKTKKIYKSKGAGGRIKLGRKEDFCIQSFYLGRLASVKETAFCKYRARRLYKEIFSIFIDAVTIFPRLQTKPIYDMYVFGREGNRNSSFTADAEIQGRKLGEREREKEVGIIASAKATHIKNLQPSETHVLARSF